MRTLFCDIESFSPVQLAKTGLYPYAEHPDFELLLFGYSIDGGPVEMWISPTDNQCPTRFWRL